MTPLPRNWRRQLASEFSDVLTNNADLRRLWLCVVLSLNPQAPIPAKYVDSWLWMLDENLPLHDPLARHEAFMTDLLRLVPSLTSWFVHPDCQVWVMEMERACAEGRRPDPCDLVDRRGRPGWTGYSDGPADLLARIRKVIRELNRQGLRPTREVVAVSLSCDVRTLGRYRAQLKYRCWADLVRDTLQQTEH